MHTRTRNHLNEMFESSDILGHYCDGYSVKEKLNITVE